MSGYGLRAWRALVWVAGITAALAIAFHLVGYLRPPQPDAYWTSVLGSCRRQFRAVVEAAQRLSRQREIRSRSSRGQVGLLLREVVGMRGFVIAVLIVLAVGVPAGASSFAAGSTETLEAEPRPA
jgi:F0F1-type ATP synthase membrane subunit c/vacuolar-type H+-ATPase subunit K